MVENRKLERPALTVSDLTGGMVDSWEAEARTLRQKRRPRTMTTAHTALKYSSPSGMDYAAAGEGDSRGDSGDD